MQKGQGGRQVSGGGWRGDAEETALATGAPDSFLLTLFFVVLGRIQRGQCSYLFYFYLLFIYLFIYLFSVLGFKFRAYTLNHSTSHFCVGFFEIGSGELFAWARLEPRSS
jgi:hypothetical protein